MSLLWLDISREERGDRTRGGRECVHTLAPLLLPHSSHSHSHSLTSFSLSGSLLCLFFLSLIPLVRSSVCPSLRLFLMKPPKSNASATLGKSLIRDRFKGRGQRRDFKEDEIAFPLSSAAQSGKPTDWTGLGSVTEQGDLEEFLMSAELADKEFLSGKLLNDPHSTCSYATHGLT